MGTKCGTVECSGMAQVALGLYKLLPCPRTIHALVLCRSACAARHKLIEDHASVDFEPSQPRKLHRGEGLGQEAF